ncbi:MAG: hypothetical protein JO352_22610 [Chloroflexi bacterium]|nr:hypothetical protein [Chloroflexota bacterium]MBV9597598.1 hypothetical protein [Chloroflexota bacterium]
MAVLSVVTDVAAAVLVVVLLAVTEVEVAGTTGVLLGLATALSVFVEGLEVTCAPAVLVDED